MLVVLAKLALAYLLGSLSGSLLLGRWRGIDVRHHGSGNAGGTNALRVAGWRFALGVVLIDVGKGALAAWIGLQPIGVEPWDLGATGAACALAAAIGHCWPAFFGFRGGKGAATLVGGVLVLAPWFAAAMFLVWLAVIATTRYVGLATVLAALAFPLGVFGSVMAGLRPTDSLLWFSLAVALLIVFTHRGNLARLSRGDEPRIAFGRRA